MKFPTFHTSIIAILKLHKITRTRTVHFVFSCWTEQGNNPKNRTCYPDLCMLLHMRKKKHLCSYIFYFTRLP